MFKPCCSAFLMPAAKRLRRVQPAFTLIELMVVLIIVSILISLLYTVVVKSRTQALEARAKAEAKALESAILSYRAANGVYPAQTQGEQDMLYLTNNMKIVSLLITNDPRSRVHLRLQATAISNALADDLYRDPWGFPYAICIDETGDGYVRGLDYNLRPELKDIVCTNNDPYNPADITISLQWEETNAAFLAAPVGVFSLKNCSTNKFTNNVVINTPYEINIRSWE